MEGFLVHCSSSFYGGCIGISRLFSKNTVPSMRSAKMCCYLFWILYPLKINFSVGNCLSSSGCHLRDDRTEDLEISPRTSIQVSLCLTARKQVSVSPVDVKS